MARSPRERLPAPGPTTSLAGIRVDELVERARRSIDARYIIDPARLERWRLDARPTERGIDVGRAIL